MRSDRAQRCRGRQTCVEREGNGIGGIGYLGVDGRTRAARDNCSCGPDERQSLSPRTPDDTNASDDRADPQHPEHLESQSRSQGQTSPRITQPRKDSGRIRGPDQEQERRRQQQDRPAAEPRLGGEGSGLRARRTATRDASGQSPHRRERVASRLGVDGKDAERRGEIGADAVTRDVGASGEGRTIAEGCDERPAGG